jgi:hypothetical protein
MRAIVAEAELKGKPPGLRERAARRTEGLGLAATDAFEEASTGLDRRSGAEVRWAERKERPRRNATAAVLATGETSRLVG